LHSIKARNRISVGKRDTTHVLFVHTRIACCCFFFFFFFFSSLSASHFNFCSLPPPPHHTEVQRGGLHTAVPGVDGLSMVGQDTFSVGLVAVLASGVLTASYLSKKALACLAVEMLFAS